MDESISLRSRILAAGIVTFLTIAVRLEAQTWDGGGTTDNFNTAANWNPNTVPVNNGTADLIFTGNVRITPTVNVNFAVDSVTFDNAASAFNISSSGGSVLTVGAGGIANNSANSQAFSTPVTFATSSSITAGAFVNFTGLVDLGTSSISVNANANVDFDAVTGTGTLVKNGTGTLNLNSPGTQNYDLTVNNGLLDLDAAMTFSASSTIDVNGGTLDLLSTVFNGATLNRASTASLTGSFTARNGASLNIVGAFATTGSFYTLENNSTSLAVGDFDLNGGSTLRVQSGADATFTTDFDIGADSGTLLVTGTGSTVSTTALAASPTFGSTGSATVTFADGAMGTFSSVTVRLAQTTGSSATMLVSSGAQVRAGTFEISAFTTSGPATVTVTGAGSKLITDFNIAGFDIGSAGGTNPAVVNVQNGAELDLSGPLIIEKTGTLNLDGGIVTLDSGQELTNNGTLNFNSGRINLGTDLGLAGAGSDIFDERLVLTTGREVSVRSNRTTTVGPAGVLILDGGEFVTGMLVNSGGVIELHRGALRITGSAPLIVGGTGPLGQNVTVPTGFTLQLPNTTVEANARLTIGGGTLQAFSTINQGHLQVDSGFAEISVLTNAAGAQVSVGGTLDGNSSLINSAGARIELLDGTGRITGANTLFNSGLLTGSGTIAKSFENAASGVVRAESGHTLYFMDSAVPNAGEFRLQGGTLEFAGSLTNESGAFISGRGALHTGGLTNSGQMAFSGGATDIRGDVSLSAGSRVVTSGNGSTTTFFDDVVHNGTEIFTGAGASTVFFGNQSGSGSFTGTGTIYYIGDLRPGSSPATVSYGGDLVFGSSSSLTLEIGGVHAGTQHDSLDVAGTLFADGLLILALIDGFLPVGGDQFQLFAAGEFAGGFDGIVSPVLPEGLFWDVSGLPSSGTVAVVPEPHAGLLLVCAGACLLRRRSAARARG